uniref:MYND-type domain-containing protein n=1 Tax=Panagrolaimus sp. ES5 TaxID=591445 RepID=A0AC34FVA0_9BILA
MAKSDAEEAIKLWPSWWKGYFRLARVQMKLEEWFQAEKTFEKTLELNSQSKEIRDELSFVRSKIGSFDHVKHTESSPEEQSGQYGMPEEIRQSYDKLAQSLPGIGDILKGHQYLLGNGVQKDYKKAVEYFTKAANMGFPEGMYNLANLYHDGNGLKQDYKESMKWYLKAANSKASDITGSKGIAEAQHAIGYNYEEGIGVKKDFQKAAEWYEKAVQLGFAPSANNLGSLYKYGMGVEKSILKAFKYFKFAAEAGETAGMFNLAICYFTDVGYGTRIPGEKDSAEGNKWLQLAAKKGDARAIEHIKNQEQIGKKFNNKDKLMGHIMGQLKLKESQEEKNPLDFEQYGKYVAEAAENGSVIAKKHMEIWKNMNDAKDAFEKDDSGEFVAALAKAIRLNYLIVEIPKIYESMIEERIKSHPNELDTNICYIQMNSKKPSTARYVSDIFKEYPDDEYLAEMMVFAKSGNPKDALKNINETLKRHPKSLSLLYCRVQICRMQKPPTKKLVESADAFIALAPKDNPYAPACYYSKALYYFNLEEISKFVECFEAGLAAEKKQLPCFLPYDFEGKAMLEMMYGCIKSSKENNSKDHHLEKIKSDPKRKLLLLKNRESFITYAKGDTTSEVFTEMIFEPSHTPQPPNWSASSLKKITLSDIDPTKDKVYNGCVLEVRIIDWIYLSANLHTIIEDENGDVNRLIISNLPMTGDRNSDMLAAIKTFHPNVKISIINPYNCIIQPGQNAIRVQSPEFFKLDNSMIDKQCHVCGKEAKILPCSACKMACYCSKDCQKLDWVEFNHKSLCKHLKMYAELMQ